MVGRPVADDEQGMLYIVVNAGDQGGRLRPASQAAAGDSAELIRADDRGLIAAAGPEAPKRCCRASCPEAAELCVHDPDAGSSYAGERIVVSRSGYTGEDGFEILVPRRPRRAAVGRGCWPDERVRPIGLGARDSLRLEAGLPLYGHDARRDHLADRGRASASRVSKRRRRRGTSRARRVSLRELAGGLDRRARRPEGAGRRAGPRGRRDRRRGRRRRRPRHQRRLLAQPRRADRHGLRPAGAGRAGTPRWASSCAARRQAAEVVAPCRSSPIATVRKP